MSKSRILHALAMEEMDEELEGNDAEAAAAEPEGIVETAQDAAEAETEVAENTEVVEELEEASDALEAIYYSLEQYREEGISPQTAQFVKIAVENIASRVGEEVDIPSHESFDGSSRSVQSTELSMEGIVDTLKKIWAKIKSWILKVWDAIKNFFKRWFTHAGRVKAKIDNFEKYASKLTGSPSHDKVKISAALANSLAVGNTFDAKSTEKAVDNLDNALDDTKSLDRWLISMGEAANKTWDVIQKKLNANNNLSDDQVASELAHAAPKVFYEDDKPINVASLFSTAAYKVDYKVDGMPARATEILPGNVRYYFYVKKQGAFKNLFASAFVCGKHNLKNKIEKEVVEDTLDIGTIRTFAAGAKGLYNKAISCQKSAEDNIKQAEKVLNGFKPTFTDKIKSHIPNTIMNSNARFLKSVGKQSAAITNHAITTASNLVNVAKLSAKLYKTK